MDSTAVKLYRNLIEWEQKEKLTFQGKEIFLGDSLIHEYRFQENYYFMGGDYMENSKDSRYWGLLPEPYIVGVATRIWKSVDKSTGKIRWDRVMKKIE
jgi:signal peptidase I